jgi:hypothetical protein
MKRLLTILLLISYPAFALTASEALKETKSAQIRIEKENEKAYKKRIKEIIETSNQWIKSQVDSGECEFTIRYDSSDKKPLLIVKKHFEKLEYDITLIEGMLENDPINMTISWCEAE